MTDASQPRSAASPQPARPELSDAAVVSRSWGMAFATLVSRITGFIRIVLLAAILGAALSSSFTVANQLPNMVAALVLEATFTAIFVPVLARAEREDPDQGTAFIRRLVTLATTLLLITTIISVLCAPLLVRLMLGGDPQVNQPLTTAFAYLLLPQVIFYGLTSVFMAILNTRNVFSAPAWAPVVNNVVAIATLGIYLVVPGELSLDPVEMGNPKLLVLGIGTTLGVVAQAAVLLIAIRRERISLRPLWGIDDRLKRFGTMASAMVLYVLISQIGLIVGNQIASTAAASGPAIYTYTWLVLMLPFGMIGVTVLTVVMPRLSRNAAAEDTPAVLADLSLATRLTMVTLIPIVALMTVGGPAIGSALFAYGKFGEVDANYLGVSIALSAFTLIPYSLVLLQLRVFYAREQPWLPIAIIVFITVVKIAASLAAPHMTDNPELVAGYLGLANGLGFLAGAIAGHLLLRRALRPSGGSLLDRSTVRTIVVTTAASLLAGLITAGVDHLLSLAWLTEHWGGAGSLLRLVVLTAIVLPIVATILIVSRVPEAVAARAAVLRRLRRSDKVVEPTLANPGSGPAAASVPYSERGNQENLGRHLIDRQPGAPVNVGTAGRGDGVGDNPSNGPQANLTREHLRQPSGPDTSGVQLIAGASIADGRYRLLVFHGGPEHLQFWQALDIALDRQVALTFVDPEGLLPRRVVDEILSRTMQLSRLEVPGVARILDVTDTGSGDLVVAEWIRGGSLQEVAETSPSPMGGARAVRSLAAAIDTAHRSDITLSIDDPSRVRVSVEGNVVLAFPATLPQATPEDDVRGAGAVLYALLVDRWPLPSSENTGLAEAPLDSAGQPVEPRVLDRSIPFQISAAAARSVQENGGIRTAPTLLNLLQQATSVSERSTSNSAAAQEPGSARRARAEALAAEQTEPDPEDLRRRKRLLWIGVAGAIAVVLLVLTIVLSQIFGDLGGDSTLDRDQLGLSPQTTSSDETAPGSAVKPVGVKVFSPGGDADAPSLARLAIDGDTATVWPTDTYSDAVPFPGFKSGVGLLLELSAPTKIAAVTVNLNSTGTSVQIRSSSTSTPAKLEDTTALTEPTKLQRGNNTIEVNSSEATSNVLVWITTLGTVDGKSRSDLAEVTVKAAG